MPAILVSTDPADLRIWFPSGAPTGSELTVCESDPVEAGRYHYEMVIPEYGQIGWHGVYTRVDRPDGLDAEQSGSRPRSSRRLRRVRD